MAKDQLKVGIIGAGGIARGVHLPSLSEMQDVHMVAIRKPPLSTKDDQIEAIRAGGVAGYYEFAPFAAVSWT